MADFVMVFMANFKVSRKMKALSHLRSRRSLIIIIIVSISDIPGFGKKATVRNNWG
jgi:hypothetical protein